MSLEFYKYQGTGNDFIIIDNRHDIFDKNNTKHVRSLCDRRFGIGADGLILLENHHQLDFKMVYFNSDGNESSMCGNGGRCITAFAKKLGVIDNMAMFEAIDGVHNAIIENGLVKLQMQDVTDIKEFDSHLFIDTGSPHVVKEARDVVELDVYGEGHKIRHSEPYLKNGTNVNFLEKTSSDTFVVRTYERGVEDETLSCGTGVTAAALYAHKKGLTERDEVYIKTRGGDLSVTFKFDGTTFTDIWLIGPATEVYKGFV